MSDAQKNRPRAIKRARSGAILFISSLKPEHIKSSKGTIPVLHAQMLWAVMRASSTLHALQVYFSDFVSKDNVRMSLFQASSLIRLIITIILKHIINNGCPIFT